MKTLDPSSRGIGEILRKLQESREFRQAFVRDRASVLAQFDLAPDEVEAFSKFDETDYEKALNRRRRAVSREVARFG